MSKALARGENNTSLQFASGPVPRGRPSWSGLLQLSLVGIPIKAYPAVRSNEVSHFHQYHADCGQRIRYLKHCPVHGTVDATRIVRGFEYGAGKHVLVEAEELDRLRPARDRALHLERFIAPTQLEPLLFAGRSLYLHPDGPAARHAYGVLHAIMVQRGKWAVGRVVFSAQRHLVLVRPLGAVLVLQVLHFPEQVHACPVGDASRPATAEELRLAGMLVDAASGSIDWPSFRNERAEELRALIEAKVAEQPAPGDEPVNGVLPLLEALKQSMATAAANGAAPAAHKAARKRGPRSA